MPRRLSTVQLDETNEKLLLSIDLTPLLCEVASASPSLFSGILPQMSRTTADQQTGFTPRRYNLRRNSDFPCVSTHASRSSEFLQVPMSASKQRAANLSQQSLSRLPRIRDIREASMDQIIFRVIETQSTPPAQLNSTDPIISVSSFDDGTSSSIHQSPTSDIRESPVNSPLSSLSDLASAVASDTPLLREIKPYSRSKTAPLSSSSRAQHFLAPKHCEARDLCGSSSNEESTSTSTEHENTFV